MKHRLVISLLVALPLAWVLIPERLMADEPSTKPTPRKQFQEQRPDDSRGWLIVSKRSYWPLCYESLDRLEEANRNIGKSDTTELADQLEKCGAWLQLAADAAMTDGQSGIVDASDYCNQAAESLRQHENVWSEDNLKDLIVLGELSMAKSHILRAALIDEGRMFPTPKSSKKPLSQVAKSVRESEAEIRAERMLRDREQYRYDAIETQRHLEVAITYLKAAQALGNFEIDPNLVGEFEDIESIQSPAEVVSYAGTDLRKRIRQLKSAVEPLQTEYRIRIKKLER